jgi:pectinesterase
MQNTAPAPASGTVGRQAVAVRVQGDLAAFYRCRFYGAQDTLYDKNGRHYYYNCYIEGSIDFIFGDARSLFVVSATVSIIKCLIVKHSINRLWVDRLINH